MSIGKFDNGRPEILAGDDWLGLGGVDVFYPASGAAGLSIFEDSDPYDGGDAQAAGEVDAFLAEAGGSGPFGAFSASAFEQSEGISFLAKQKGRTRKEALKSITLEDFEEGAQRWAAGTLIAAVRYFLRNVEKPDAASDAAQWIFGHSDEQASFENCCLVNEARADVLRMRIQYELWRCGKRMQRAFPFAAALPEFVANKVLFTVGVPGMRVAKILWNHPGIPDEDLRAQLGRPEVDALNVMTEKYIASPVETSPVGWYLTSINPIQEELDRSANSMRNGVALATYSLTSRRARSTDLSWSSRFGED